jgi:hypothetical protein
LFNLTSDIRESRNQIDQHPDIAERLTKLLEEYVADGRSTAGVPQKNTVEVQLRKPLPRVPARKRAARR